MTSRQIGKPARYAGAFAFVLVIIVAFVVIAGDCQALHRRCTVIHMHSHAFNGREWATVKERLRMRWYSNM